jgi:hypothetical protein
MSAGPVYQRREVVFLLSLKESDARDLSDDVRSCAAGWGHKQHSLSPADTQPTPLIVRWHDVHLARDRVRELLSAEHDRIVERRINGETGMGLAARLGVSEATVQRKLHSMIDAILNELGGEAVITEAASQPAACLKCGQRPRTRVVTYGAKVRGKPRPRTERQSSLCTDCLGAAAKRAGRTAPETTTLIDQEAA